MLANKYFEHQDKVVGKNFTLTTKLDGIRCITLKENGKVTFWSRQGHHIEHLVEIEPELEQLQADNFMLDGELLISNRSGAASKDQYKATTQIVRTLGVKQGVTYNVFDGMSLQDYQSRHCGMSFDQRRDWLKLILPELTHVKIVPELYSGTDVSKIDFYLQRAIQNHEEGIMININDALYSFTRSSTLLKVKVMHDCDLRIVAAYEGDGRLTGTLGALGVDYKGSELGVGTGFSDEDRALLWAQRDQLVGRVVTVQYFEETHDAKGIYSLRFPVFKGLREKGKAVNY